MDDKEKHVSDWKASGKTQREYCEMHNINISTFQSWVRKVASDAAAIEKEAVAEVVEAKPQPTYAKPFFMRITQPFLQNVNVGGRYIPCRKDHQYFITDDMDIDVLKQMQSLGIIKLFGV